MIKLLLPFILLVLLQSFATTSFAQFPYTESFRNSTATGIVFGGAPSAFLTASGSSANGGTPIDPNGSGYLRLTNAQLNQKGFAYSTSDFPSSNGLKVEFEYCIYGGTGADGISFFLFDATADPFTIGGFGGSLGYAQITTTVPTSPGVSKGYLGIGLDEFGNFSNPNEGRQGGTTKVAGSVTIRGKGNGTALTSNNYRFLVSQRTDLKGVSLVGNSSTRVTNPTSPDYRRVYIELIPSPAGGYNINVRIAKGGPTIVYTTIIDNYYYPDAAPENLRYGFASSTGANTNFHEIRNVAIDLYNQGPVAINDVSNLCSGTTASIDITANDRTIVGNTIDKSSIDLNPSTPGIQKSIAVNGKGIFTVNNIGVVEFVPVAGFNGTASAQYTVNDSAGITSGVATITFNYNSPPVGINAGTDKLVNISSSIGTYKLQGNDPVSDDGLWTQISGPNNVNFVNATSHNTDVTTLTGGVYVFRWTVTSSNGCSASDDVEITVNRNPIAYNDAANTSLNTAVPISIINNDVDEDGNSTINKASVIIKSQPQNGTLTVNYATGVVTYLPNSGYSGTDNFTYTVKDLHGAESNEGTVTVSVNKALVGVDDIATTLTNTPIVIHVLDNDPKKTDASILKITDPSNGNIVINSDNTISYNPIVGYSGKDSFSYKLVNNNGDQSDPVTVSVSVKPTGTPDLGNTVTNLAITIPVKDNDNSKTGTTVIINTNPTNGTINTNTSNVIIYTPNPGYSEEDNFTYLLRTADGLESDPIAVKINVRPLGSNDEATTVAGTSVSIEVNENDASNTDVAVIINSNPLNGTISINASGRILYTPNPTFSGKDNFRYILQTPNGIESNPISVLVNVKPIGTPDQKTFALNTPLVISVKDNDLSKANTTVRIDTDPSNGTLSVNNNGEITYTPNAGFLGNDTFNYILRTADGLDSFPITVTLTPTATTPTGSPDISNTTTNNSVTIPVKDNDASQTGTTVVIASNPTNGSVVLNGTGVPVYTPTAGFSGKDTFTYKLRNSGGTESDPITVTVNVKPVGTSNEVTTPAATQITIPVKDNDLSKAGTTVIITGSPANGTIAVNPANEISYTPSSTFSGKDNLIYILRTADGLESDPINVLINVKPVGSADNEGYNLNTPKTIAVKDNDLSKTNTTVVINSSPANGTAAVNGTGVITYTPNTGFSGTNSFTYILRTADGMDSDPITVTVTPITPQPTGSPDISNTVTNAPVTISVKDNDVSKTGTTVVIDGSPANGNVVINGTGDPVYTPANGFSGKDSFTYKLRNNTGGLESDPITVTVNVRPSGSPDNGTFAVNTPLNIEVKNNDLSKTGTTVVINSNPANGTASVNGAGMVTYTPNAGYTGSDGFTYVLRTADGLNSDPINVAVTAIPLPVRPSGSPDVATTPSNTPVTIPIKNNDASGSGSTATVQASPVNGTVSINPAGEAVYTPTTGFSGKDTFPYILTNNNGLQSDPISVTVNVKPIGSNDNASTPINIPVTIDIKNNDLSKSGTTPVVNGNPEHGTVTINAAGNAIFTPVAGYTGADSFTYRLRTADGVESDPIIVVVIVTPAGQVPDVNVNIPTDKPVTVDIPVPAGSTIVITVPPKHGEITFDPVTGKPIYTPNPGYSGPDDFTYVIRDGNGNDSTPGKVNITVVKPAKIGLAKALASSVRSGPDSFKLTYIFTVKNYGDAAINQLSLIDNLSAAFPARLFTITRLAASGTLRVNPGFNGSTATEMLLSSSTLGANASETIELEVTVVVNQQSGTFLNTATVMGRSVSDGSTISDVSTSGLIPDPNTPGNVTPATPTQAIILIAPNIAVPVSSGQPLTVNVPVPQGGSVVIVTPPANGTITFDPVTGQPIYTPNPGYSGPDEFNYIVRDANGNQSQPGTITLTVTAPAKIGLAKALLTNTKNIDGSFSLTYQFTLVNYGDFTIQNLSLTDNLALAFVGAKFEIVNIKTTGDLKVNTEYNGSTVLNMLLPTSTLEAKTKEFVEMQVRIVLDKDRATFNNFAVAEGASVSGAGITTDQSTNGFNPDPDVSGDVTPSVLTPVTLTKELLKIPGGFSPNNDGINDFFVVENAQGKKIELEIFNRWGNRVFRSKDYQNTWNGRSNEGIRLGEDLPVGTYYYIIKIEGENKRVGYITINR